MRPTHANTSAPTTPGLLKGPRGSCARVVVSLTAAGGVSGGGIVVGGLTIAGVVSPGLQLLAAPVLFLVGAFLGAVHGGILAVAGRPDGVTGREALKGVVVGLIACLPVLGAAWVVTAGISLTAALVREFRLSWAFLSLGGWLFGLSLCTWALVEGWSALKTAYARWPGGRLGTALTTLILVGATGVMMWLRPEIWGTDLRLNGFGALILAVAFTLWVGFPLVWTLLRVAHPWLPADLCGGEAETSA